LLPFKLFSEKLQPESQQKHREIAPFRQNEVAEDSIFGTEVGNFGHVWQMCSPSEKGSLR
jgi:hypothetical protein